MREQVVCFDLGGVLIRVEQRWSHVLARAEVQSSFMPSPEFRLGHLRALEELQDGTMDNEAYLDTLCSTFGLTDQRSAALVHDAILVEEMDHAAAFVSQVKAHGFRVGCLSNTNGLHWKSLMDAKRFPVMQLLDHTIVSHELQLAKPEPAIYHAFEQRFGVGPESIVFFDDTHLNVVAAKKLGWNAVLIDPCGNTIDQMRDALSAVSLSR